MEIQGGMKPLTIESLGSTGLNDSINDALSQIAADVVARPNVSDNRTVTIKITLKPEIEDAGPRGSRMTAKAEWGVSPSVPGQRSIPFRVFGDLKHGLVINTSDPTHHNPNQGTIFDAQKEG